MTAPFDGARVPMLLLGGYLGAGKTTLVNHLLRSTGERIVVLVNDVGAIDVDRSLIAAQSDATIELTNGCVCCSLVDGFAVALEQVRSMGWTPDHVVVELSGVAEPARVVPWAATAGFRLGAVAVAVDADQIRDRAADPKLRDLVEAQLAAADILLVTKRDLVADDDDEVGRWLAERSTAPVVDAPFGAVDAALLLGVTEAQHGHAETNHADPASAGAHGHVVATIEVAGVHERRRIKDALGRLPPGVVRVKGIVDTADGPRLCERVGHRVSVAATDVAATNSLVVIALDAGDLERSRGILGAMTDEVGT